MQLRMPMTQARDSLITNYQQRKTIEQAVRTAPLQSAKSLARNLSNLSPSKQVQWNKYKAVGRVVSSVRAESTTMELCGIRVDSSHGSLNELCTSLSFANKIRSHNDDASQYHLNLFDPVCLHHDIRAEHNIVIMVFSTQWMLLNHARAFNSGVATHWIRFYFFPCPHESCVSWLHIDQLTGLFDTGKNTPIHLLKAKNDEYHQRFMTLREKGVLEGKV